MTGFEIFATACLVGMFLLQGFLLRSLSRRAASVSRAEIEEIVDVIHERAAREQRANVSELDERIRGEVGVRARETASHIGEVREWIDRKFVEMTSQERQNWGNLEKSLKEQDTDRRTQIDVMRNLLEDKFVAFVGDLEKNRTVVEVGLKDIGEKGADHNIRALQAQTDQADRINRRLQEQTESVGTTLKNMQATIEKKLHDIQGSNEKKLEEMRQTVDEKLQTTLEQRIGESFKQVVVNLESVQRGLGEMQTLAKGVGDLNRVFSNVKTRGVLGEVQLRAILEEMLRPDQFVRNFKPKANSGETVEFAIKIPNSKRSDGGSTYIPIDAKFPREDYERLQLASEAGDVPAMEAARKGLLARIEVGAKDICNKYIAPPETTNFGIMFLATEGLYAEALRVPGFQEKLQREYHVIVAGPTTLSAILCSLSVGFQTVDIERRSSEIHMVLSAVKTEFGKFSQVLRNVKRQLGTASNSIDKTFVRTRQMEGALDGIAAMPADKTTRVFEMLGGAFGGSKEISPRPPRRRSRRSSTIAPRPPNLLRSEIEPTLKCELHHCSVFLPIGFDAILAVLEHIRAASHRFFSVSQDVSHYQRCVMVRAIWLGCPAS